METVASYFAQNLTVPLTEVVRAHISDSPVNLPVRGPSYARLEHITAVPARSQHGGFSLTRLQAIDTMLARIARMQDVVTPDMDPIELEEQRMEELALRIEEEARSGDRHSLVSAGLLLDTFA